MHPGFADVNLAFGKSSSKHATWLPVCCCIEGNAHTIVCHFALVCRPLSIAVAEAAAKATVAARAQVTTKDCSRAIYRRLISNPVATVETTAASASMQVAPAVVSSSLVPGPPLSSTVHPCQMKTILTIHMITVIVWTWTMQFMTRNTGQSVTHYALSWLSVPSCHSYCWFGMPEAW